MASSTACHRCRHQKRKCSRDMPVCQRCRELEAHCEYPSPPNRRLLAIQRWQRKADRNQEHMQLDDLVGLLRSYYPRSITSDFLFNQKDFFVHYWDGKISPYLLRNLCAFASIFTREVVTAQSSNLNLNMMDLDLSLSRTPVDDLLGSFPLSFYWFARESTFMACLHLILRGGVQAFPSNPQIALSLFGVYWSIRCFIKNTQSFDSSFALHLPDEPYLSGKPPHSDRVTEEHWATSKLLALMGRWLHVRKFLTALRAAEDQVSMFSTLTKMDIETTPRYNSFKADKIPSLGSSSSSLQKSLVSEILYHKCRAVSFLYMFRANQLGDNVEHEFIDLSGSVGVRHMHFLPPFVGFSTYLAASLQLGALGYLYTNHDEPPVLSSEGALINALRLCVFTNLSILNRLRPLWVPLQMMWERLMPLFHRASLSPQNLEVFASGLPSIPLVDEDTAMKLQAFVTSHLPQTMRTMDMDDSFYLPLDIQATIST
ncbi:hypothetical protein BJY01DRAFT_241224 [Aspergillus pseudoustus]|uniref:Zn(2)-C6 fungal-type domain-containing protein n=1 Tax=Aspergillus pseudoustus TaxID=1810923 RepID=A0ABR4IJZ1_9EURO